MLWSFFWCGSVSLNFTMTFSRTWFGAFPGPLVWTTTSEASSLRLGSSFMTGVDSPWVWEQGSGPIEGGALSPRVRQFAILCVLFLSSRKDLSKGRAFAGW